MNILIAVAVMWIAFTVSGVPVNSVGNVDKDMPAYEAGIREGDRIISVDGEKTSSWNDTRLAISKAKVGESVECTVERDGEEKTFTVDVEKKEGYSVIGVTADLSHNPVRSLKYGVISTWNMNKEIINSFVQLFTGGLDKDDVSGPVGMVKLVDQTREYGIVSFLMLVAIISINLAILNLLPFPALDGGRILFVIIRKITGNRISDEAEGFVHMAGMLILLGFFLFVTWNDIVKIFIK